MSKPDEAYDGRILDRLIAEFGEEQARKILSGPPAKRAAQAPTKIPATVGVRAQRRPAWATRNAIRSTSPSWGELRNADLDLGQKIERVWKCRAAWRSPCKACGQTIEAGEEAARLFPSHDVVHFLPGCIPDKR